MKTTVKLRNGTLLVVEGGTPELRAQFIANNYAGQGPVGPATGNSEELPLPVPTSLDQHASAEDNLLGQQAAEPAFSLPRYKPLASQVLNEPVFKVTEYRVVGEALPLPTINFEKPTPTQGKAKRGVRNAADEGEQALPLPTMNFKAAKTQQNDLAQGRVALR